MKLNLNSFKKVGQDKDRTHFENARGHRVSVAHAGLSEKYRKALQDLPVEGVKNMAGGGEVQKFDDGGQAQPQDSQQAPVHIEINSGAQPPQMPPAVISPQDIAQNQQARQIAQGDSGVQPGQTVQLSNPSMVAPANMEMPQAPVPSNPLAAQNQAESQNYLRGLGMQEAGEFGAANTVGQQGRADAEAARQHQMELQSARARIQQNVNEYKNESSAVVKDIQNGHINPNQYMESMSAKNKVTTALGILAGGFAVGAGGQNLGNGAMDYLNKQIDRNIDSQKANLANKNNLLHAFNERFKNIDDAEQMMRAVELDNYAAQLKGIAGQYAGPLAQQQAMAHVGELEQKSASIKGQLAMKTALFSGKNGDQSGNGSMAELDPAQLVSSLVPKDHQKEVFEELGRAENVSKNREKMMEAFDRAADQIKIMPGDRSGVKAFHQLLLPNFKQIDGTVRQAAMDETFHNLTPQALDSSATLKSKRQAFEDWMKSESAAPTSRGFFLDPENFKKTSSNPELNLNSQEKQWVQFARKNPSDPRSKLVLQKLKLEK